MSVRYHGKPEKDAKEEIREEVEQMSEYMTTLEAAVKWGITTQAVAWHCRRGNVEGAMHDGARWAIPANAEKPDDMRYKSNQVKNVIEKKFGIKYSDK